MLYIGQDRRKGPIMAKITSSTLTYAHVRGARGFLKLTMKELAQVAGSPVTHSVVRNLENGLGASTAAKTRLIEYFESAGIRLTNGGKPGVNVYDSKLYEHTLKGLKI